MEIYHSHLHHTAS